MFAVIKTGGKQYKVTAGDIIAVEKLPHEAGSDIDLDQVLMIGDGATMTVGTPLVAGACVAAHVMEQTKGDKIIIFKKKRRQNYRRRRGHRQNLTVLQITDIVPAGATRKPKAARPAPKPAAKAQAPAAKAKPAAKKKAKPAKKVSKKAKPAAKKSAGKGKTGGKSKEKK
ncbi:MAG TPA: 50S ribosomal protein L21 [Alphaproteobacteria bacterium]|nr:50S ribosomal protein L21 [Alphaproteobacteria bacterium]